MTRIFNFGCSFTKYYYPTWADIYENEVDLEIYNFGRAGAGNYYIFTKILEADIIYQFNSNDIINIIWTTWLREDKFVNDEWQTFGNIFNTGGFYDKKYLTKYWSTGDAIIKNSNCILLINKLYKDTILFQSNISLLSTIGNETPYEENKLYDLLDKENKLLNLYLPEIKKIQFEIPSIMESDLYEGYKYDDHPTILSHIEILKQVLKYNKIEVKLDLQKYLKLDEKIKKFNCRNFKEYITKLRETTNEYYNR